jgi:hypothetical protein
MILDYEVTTTEIFLAYMAEKAFRQYYKQPVQDFMTWRSQYERFVKIDGML